jgi:hypothetical protein
VALPLRPLSSAKRCSKLSKRRAVSAPGGGGILGADPVGVAEVQMDRKSSVLPPLNRTAPGSQAQGLKLTWDRSKRSSPNRPNPAIAAIIPNFRML